MDPLKIAFIGSGDINFGGVRGPWNHSKRLERIPNTKIVAILDVDISKAKSVLEEKLKGSSAAGYSNCKLFSSLDEMLLQLKGGIDAVWIGVPPYARGAMEPGRDMELRCIRENINVFVEKPLSVSPAQEVAQYAEAISKETCGPEKPIISVGYMFRYHPAVLKARECIHSHDQPLLMINARYNCAYSEFDYPFWWDKKKSGGPIVTQATHFCDLIRFLGGEVHLDSIATKIVPPGIKGEIGYLSKVPEAVKEDSLLLEDRAPRVTVSHFYFKSGAVGSLTHGLTLQGHARRYETSLEVWSDGLRVTLEDPYYNDLCRLRIRKGYTNSEEVFTFPDADCYMDENVAFIKAISEKNPSHVASPYSDALETYKFSWAIANSIQK